MAGKEIRLGPTGEQVRDNVRRLREARNLTYQGLSEELEKVGRRIPPLGIRRIEDGQRRVDIDDFMALAAALWVDPPILLLPEVIGASLRTEVTGLGEVATLTAQSWVTHRHALEQAAPDDAQLAFLQQASPRRYRTGEEEALERQLDELTVQLSLVRRRLGELYGEADTADESRGDEILAQTEEALRSYDQLSRELKFVEAQLQAVLHA